ncbi:hypothetical protein I553_3832 [Mycobacterium xenopi 4042]|uniref:Uncharacterized protein n=1 Tax=Mycobacterium xenopi 4042 TaxID=1299334 RepID=X7YTY2_MYCXE|nr:hypothetical protein I553_3832 [Mycobacterium xenopi 4042]
MNGCCMTAAKPTRWPSESWVAEFTERRRVVAVHPSSHRCELVRAHNMSLVTAYLQHEHLASRGPRERFFINLVLVRVLYTHALVPRRDWRSAGLPGWSVAR